MQPKDHKSEESQRTKFETLARELDCDEDEAAFKANLKRVAKAPRVAEKPEGDL